MAILTVVHTQVAWPGSEALRPQAPIDECVKEDPRPFSVRNHSLPLLTIGIIFTCSC